MMRPVFFLCTKFMLDTWMKPYEENTFTPVYRQSSAYHKLMKKMNPISSKYIQLKFQRLTVTVSQ